MSLLSRFRRTVLPSNSRNKKTIDDDVRHYNYRQPTKSFNEKSVKSKSSHSCTDSHDGTNYYDAKEKSAKNSSSNSNNNSGRLSRSSIFATSNKSPTKMKLEDVDSGTLSRSDTFTLEEEANLKNGTYQRSKKKEKSSTISPYRESNVATSFDDSKANDVNKDVFETFYLKRTSKSSHSSKSSNDSIRGADDLAPPLNKSNTIFTTNGKGYSSFNGKSSSLRSDKTKPQQYLFGSTFTRKTKDEPEKENIYTNNNYNNAKNNTIATVNNNNTTTTTAAANNNNINNNNNNSSSINSDSDRFKTITINSLRRSFRDSFLETSKPAKGREHQQLWFIDVNDKREKKYTESKKMIEKPKESWHQINDRNEDDDDKYGSERRRVKRNETFRVDRNDATNSPRNTSLGRRETFRINKDQSPIRSTERSPSVDSTNSHSFNSMNKSPVNGKVIPIAVTAPYSASNDTIYDRNSMANRNVKTEYYGHNKYKTYDDPDHNDSSLQYRHPSDDIGNIRDNSPSHFGKLNHSNRYPISPAKTLIEIKSPTNKRLTHSYNRDPFEKRSLPERQSFNDYNATFDRPRANPTFASLRSKFGQDSQNNRHNTTNDSNYYDTVDAGDGKVNDLYGSSHSSPKDSPWRSITSRQFNRDKNTENRSFVPYRTDYDNYEDHKFTPKTNNDNRTTISINFNNNLNSKTSKTNQHNELPHRHTFSIPLTANKSPSAIKSKPNKNRSVNFPSVECEVRLISPNYDTKPRRRESWKSKPTNDWTFNKEIVIKEIVNGTKCLACKPAQCPGGFEPHLWRKTCLVCKCPRDTHAIYQEQVTSVKERLGFKPTTNVSTLDAKQLGYTWIPPGITTTNKIRQYFDLLPEDKVPKINTAGERYREQQLSYQWPKQDLALSHCNHIEPPNNASYEDFVAGRNEIALDIAYVKEINGGPTECVNCDEDIESLAVIAPKFRDEVLWHPKCFVCSTCDELLVDLTYCVHDDKIYCERHYAELLKPRCNACDELIFSGEYTKAMNQDWHSGHFCCWQCDESLTGQRYVLRDDHPYCIKCYENVFANTCDECNKIIGIDSKDLSYKEKHWHEACFLCNKCRISLVDKQFGSKAEKIYCGNCYDVAFASRCDGCGEVFRAGTKKMEYKTRQWHEKCFSCCVCKNPIGTKSFIPKEQDIYCAGCYEEKFATRCIKCSKIITSGGVTYKNDPWHRECFTCTHCSTSLAGQRFTSRDDKPYCAECFGELFAKRCTACTKPITGIGGTRFISFEDRHWHNDCFICASCKSSLVGRGFITDEADIICPDCAKAKLM